MTSFIIGRGLPCRGFFSMLPRFYPHEQMLCVSRCDFAIWQGLLYAPLKHHKNKWINLSFSPPKDDVANPPRPQMGHIANPVWYSPIDFFSTSYENTPQKQEGTTSQKAATTSLHSFLDSTFWPRPKCHQRPDYRVACVVQHLWWIVQMRTCRPVMNLNQNTRLNWWIHIGCLWRPKNFGNNMREFMECYD